MNVKEHRVGSLFLLRGSVVEFDSHKAWHIHNLEPIPITKKWLIKMGFVCHNDGYCILERLKFGFTLSYNDYGSEKINLCMGTYCSEGNDIPHVKYVHQIQNLHFDLTGEELIIS